MIDFKFSSGAWKVANRRQFDWEYEGTTCAGCREHLNSSTTEAWPHPIPRIPIKIGGKTGANCVIVCPKCAKKMGQDGTKTIPMSDLPFFYGSKI